MKKHARLFILWFAAVAIAASAQNSAQKVEFAQNMLEGFSGLGKYVQDRNIQKSIDRFIDVHSPDITKSLIWTSQTGFLVEVRVQSSPTGSEMLLGTPILHGPGSSPEQILLSTYSKPQLIAAPGEGFSESLEKTHFLWIRYKKPLFSFQKGELERGVIPPHALAELRNHVGERLADIAFVHASIQAHEMELMRKSVDHYRRISKDAERAQKLADTLNKIEKDRETIKNVERNLAKAQERQQRASSLLSHLQALKTVLTVTQMAAQVRSSLDLAVVGNTPEDILQKTSVYEKAARDESLRLRDELSGLNAQVSSGVLHIRTETEAAGAAKMPPWIH